MNKSVYKLELTKVDKKLRHLSGEQIAEVVDAYYNGDKIPDILTTYNIKTSSSSLVRIFPPAITDGTCTKCEGVVLAPLPSRTSYSGLVESTYYCGSCGHQDKSYCSCSYCNAEALEKIMMEEKRKKIELERKRQFIQEYFSEDGWGKVEENELTLEDRVYLSVVLRAALAEDTTTIEPLESWEGSLAPTPELEKIVIRTLTGKDILLPSSKSSIHAFEVEGLSEDEQPKNVTYYTYKVRYWINVEPEDGDYAAMVRRLMYPDLSEETGFKEFCYEMWKQIALSECLAYLLYQMKKVGYSFSPGEKTVKVFEELLEHFSVSQIYSIIYRAIANSTQRYQAREITKIHAQNSVISSCESYGQRAIAQGWKLTQYSRVKDLSESHLSQVFFTSIMQIAELGFSETPTPYV